MENNLSMPRIPTPFGVPEKRHFIRWTRLVAVLLIAIIGGAVWYAASTNFPSQQTRSPSISTTFAVQCAEVLPTPANIFNSTGAVLYNCGSTAAFSVLKAGAFAAAITFASPGGNWTDAFAIPATSLGSCTAASAGTLLISGNSNTFVQGDYNYCIHYAGRNNFLPTSLPVINFAWSQ